MTITAGPGTTTAAAPSFDQAAVRRWLGILHADSPGQIHICSTGDWTGKLFTSVDAATGYVEYLNGQGREGIYVRVTSMRGALAPGKRGGAADSAALPALWADLDLAGPGHAEQDLPPDEAAGRAVIAATGLPEPTIWIHSGGGLYPIWLLTRPVEVTDTNLAALKRLAADWQRVIEHAAASKGWRYGRGVGDLARVLRVPGTVNRKAGLERPCRIVSGHPARYRVEELQAALDTAVARIAPPPTPQASVGSPLLGTVGRPDGALKPGEDFNQRATWHQILEPAGWRVYYTQDDTTYWTRPGKPNGISAATNHLGTDHLKVFTTSATGLEGGEYYSKFGAYAALHFGGSHKEAGRALGRQGYGSPLPDPAEQQRADIAFLLGETATPTPAAASKPSLFDQASTPAPAPAPSKPAPATPARLWKPEVEVTNTAAAADWLRDGTAADDRLPGQGIGRGRLAGFFRRLDAVVHTPREGEDGYVPLTEGTLDNDGPAQIRPVNDSTLASRISYTFGVYRMVKRGEDWEPVQALFPRPAARTALDVPDMLPHLRTLRGVIHSPVFRADGSLIEAPGYDQATGLLHLPEAGLHVPPVPDQPTQQDVTDAIALLDQMLEGFPFVSEHYRANYLGALLTPLLRAITPPPYKLHAIEAHQPGSGKTLLANLARHIHGGVFRAELPEDDAELRKQITAILSITTGPVVVLDNVSGKLQSSTMAGLLTTDLWDDRPLGSTAWTRATNDRIWTVTGNNLAVGGDLPRRTIRTVIDPGQPNPELRVGFAIANLEAWVKEHRGQLLNALLTIVRAWVVAGKPLPPERASDGYARWTRTVEGILTNAGIAGQFDHKSTQIEVGTDDDEWSQFLAAAHKAFGDRVWTAKELLGEVDTGNLINPGLIPADALPEELAAKASRSAKGPVGLIPADALPEELAAKASRSAKGPVGVAKTLGWWLSNREGRWAGGLAVRCVGKESNGTKEWQIRTSEVGAAA